VLREPELNCVDRLIDRYASLERAGLADRRGLD